MSSFLNFTNVYPYILDELEKRKNYEYISTLIPWIRLSSGVNDGLIIYTNPDFKLFSSAGDDASIYGNDKLSGTIGKTWEGKAVNANVGRGFRPSPGVTSLEIEEGVGSLSRKAKFSINCFTLEQLDQITKYFLEPGFTVFLEWGWNTPQSLIGYKDKLDTNYVASFNSFKKTDEVRISSGGHYDNYLGFITGGSISFEDNGVYTVSVEMTGFAELPAYLGSGETGKENKKETGDLEFTTNNINRVRDIGVLRFMYMFNELPKNRRVKTIKDLDSDRNIANPINFLNFEKQTSKKINDLTDSGWVKWDGSDSELEVEGILFPEDVEIVKENDKYIKLGTAFDILSKGTGVNGYRIGDKIIKFEINYKNVPITAFENIYSLDGSKLFIPNPNTPKFELEVLEEINTDFLNKIFEGDKKPLIQNTFDNSVEYRNQRIQFPESEEFNKVKESDGENSVFSENLKKAANEWGYLENLYINFNFFKNIIDTENFYIKDAITQILNGLSDAVNGLWDFQIEEVESDKDVKTLSILEMNFVPDNVKDEISLDVDILGADTYILDSQFNIDIPQAVQNSIITNRLGSPTNTNNIRVPKTLFAQDEIGNPLTDKVLSKIDEIEIENNEEQNNLIGPLEQNVDTRTDEEIKEEIKEKNIKLFTEKLKFIPKSKITKFSDIESPIDLYDICNLVSYENSNLFSLLKVGYDKNTPSVSPMLPIDFEFTIQGLSGIKRGDKFKVSGIPRKFRNGFFQVTDITHSISGNNWTTKVKGSYRQI